MKSLKKHQAFEAEIMANAERIRAIKQVRMMAILSVHVILAVNIINEESKIHYTPGTSKTDGCKIRLDSFSSLIVLQGNQAQLNFLNVYLVLWYLAVYW